jgi:hypothetical protein
VQSLDLVGVAGVEVDLIWKHQPGIDSGCASSRVSSCISGWLEVG